MAESDNTKKLATGFEKLSGAVASSIPVVRKLGTELGSMAKTFQDLSVTGNSFNNDMVAMRVAAANARLSLDEYAKVLTDNTKNNAALFTGLGGSVSQGTRIFGDFSKAFFESGLTENLRQMGYTSKDLNELLAVQIGFQKSSTDNTVEGQARTAKAAAELGAEMDMVAKLTGVSRREQEEKLKKAAVDGQVESKFRLIAAEQGFEAEKKAREAYAQQLLQAEAIGQGQLFKEFFATGTATSKDAQMQLALFGDASMKTAESAKELSYANIEASKSAMENAKQANMANQSNRALLTLGAIGVGDAAKAVAKNVEVNDAAYQGLKTFMKGTDDVAEAMKKQRDAILEEQKKRAGLTQVMITAQARMQDFEAGLTSIIGTFIKNSEQSRDPKTGKATGSLSALGDLTQKVPGGTGGKTNDQLAKEYVESKGQGKNLAPMLVKGFEKAGGFEAAKKIDTKIVTTVETGIEWLSKIYQGIKEIRDIRNEKPIKREGGSIEAAGKLFEDWGKGTLAELHGLEAVIKPDQMMNFAKGMGQEGASIAFNNIKGMLTGQEKGKGIDISKIGNEIKTTVSKVEILNWPKDIFSNVKITGLPSKSTESASADTKKSEAQNKTEKAQQAIKESGDTLPKQEKARTEAEQAQIKQQEQEAKFRRIGIEKGEAAEKKAREDYAREQEQQVKLTKWREDELKARIIGIREGTEAEKKFRDTLPNHEKARTEAEQAQIKQQEQEAKFRRIGIEKGEAAEKKAREDYAREQEQQVKLTKWREDELKARIIGIREGTEAEKKFRDTLPNHEKARTEAEQAQIKQQEQEAKFRRISIEKGETAEKKAREDYAREQEQQVKLTKWREDELKIQTTGIREGAEAAQKMRDSIAKQADVKTIKTSETKVTVDGKNVDPNSPEGQAVIKQMDAVKANLENSMSSMLNLTKNSFGDIAELKNDQSKISNTKVTINGKDVDPNSKEGQSVVKEMEESKNRLEKMMSSMMSGVVEKRTEPREREQEKLTNEVVKENLPIQGLQEKSDNLKLKAEQDYNDHWVKTRDEATKKVLALEEKAAHQKLDKFEKNELENQKLMKEAADSEIAIRAANIEKYKKETEETKVVKNDTTNEMSNLTNLTMKDQKNELEKQAEPVQNVFKNMIPIKEMQQQQSHLKSKLTDEEKKFLAEVTSLSKEHKEELRTSLWETNNLDRESIAKHNDIIKDLQKKKNERELTAEEEHQLSVSTASAKNMQDDVEKRQEQLHLIRNMRRYNEQIELETLEEQARKELELMKEVDAEKTRKAEEFNQEIIKEQIKTDDARLDATKHANDLLQEQFLLANDAILGSVGGMTDAVISAQDVFMQEVNALFDMPVDSAAEDQFEMPPDLAAKAQETLMQEVNASLIGRDFDSDISEFIESRGNDSEELRVEDPVDAGIKERDFDSDIFDLIESRRNDSKELDMAAGPVDIGVNGLDFDSDISKLITGMNSKELDMAAGPVDIGVNGLDFDSDGSRRNDSEELDMAAGPVDTSAAGLDVTSAMNNLSRSLPQAQELNKEPPKSESQFSRIDMGGFTLGPNGLPIPKPKAQGQEAANAVKQEKEADKNKATQASVRQIDNQIDKTNTAKDSDKKQSEGDKSKKTLDDVVKVLEQLNMSIGRLTNKVEESGKQQVQATKNLNGNLYNV
jgi:hypothetical protein